MASLRTIARDLIGDRAPECLLTWPPDCFVLTSRALGTSDAYRRIVSPPAEKCWPALHEWCERIERGGARWRSFCNDEWIIDRSLGKLEAGEAATSAIDAAIRAPWDQLQELWDQDLEHLVRSLEEDGQWRALIALVQLHAMADHACREICLGERAAGADAGEESQRFLRAAERRLEIVPSAREHVSLATLDRARGCVLPKTHTTQLGLSLRSISHHLAYHRYATDIRWFRPYPRGADSRSDSVSQERAGPHQTRNVLLFPWPFAVRGDMFKSVESPHGLVDGHRYFAYTPETLVDSELEMSIGAILDAAERELVNGTVDLLVMPEAAVSEDHWRHFLERMTRDLRAGKRRASFRSYVVGTRSEPEVGFGTNRAQVGFWIDADGDPARGRFERIDQDKHHRWRIDRGQIKSYNLGGSLSPEFTWWEGIQVPERTVTFIEPVPGITVCPLICEDLARQDPVASMLRAVGPNLVICLLMDGPQLASRWSSKYASVLADDPGSSVLTLTSRGMVDRWSSPYAASRDVVALWRDATGMVQELELGGGDALLLRIRTDPAVEYTVDGRKAVRQVLVLDGVTRLRV